MSASCGYKGQPHRSMYPTSYVNIVDSGKSAVRKPVTRYAEWRIE